MTVRQQSVACAALLALLLGSGCGDGDVAPVAAEAEEPHFRQGQQLARQGREPEALTSFLKVIEKRGEQNAPESHLEAGLIYLKHIKDPIEAIHHFRKYRELKPNSQQAGLVRQQEAAAIREFAARLPARPGENQSVRIEVADELERLRRENAEMRAELATLRDGGAIPVSRVPRMFTVPDNSGPRVPRAEASPITLAPIAAATAPPTRPPPRRRSRAGRGSSRRGRRRLLARRLRRKAQPARAGRTPSRSGSRSGALRASITDPRRPRPRSRRCTTRIGTSWPTPTT